MSHPTASERNRRYRQRKRKHICCVMVEIGEPEIDLLVSEGHLDERESANPFRIAAAVNKMMTRRANG